MKHREASKTTDFNKSLKKLGIYGIVEYKYIDKNTFNISKFEPHQIPSGIAFQESGLVWKLSDADPREKPGDVLSLPPGMTYWIGLIFENTCYFIFLDRLLDYGKASVSKEKAKELATYVVMI